MPGKIGLPIRMCIACRSRHPQNVLIRLQCIDGALLPFEGTGRSFYLCHECLVNEKKLNKTLMRQCKSSDIGTLLSSLREIITHNGKS